MGNLDTRREQHSGLSGRTTWMDVQVGYRMETFYHPMFGTLMQRAVLVCEVLGNAHDVARHQRSRRVAGQHTSRYERDWAWDAHEMRVRRRMIEDDRLDQIAEAMCDRDLGNEPEPKRLVLATAKQTVVCQFTEGGSFVAPLEPAVYRRAA